MLNQYEKAIEYFNQAISINPKCNTALNNKGFALDQLKKYQDAIFFLDQALSICISPSSLKRKGTFLNLIYKQLIHQWNFRIFELNFKQEAKQVYLDTLRQGSNKKDYKINNSPNYETSSYYQYQIIKITLLFNFSICPIYFASSVIYQTKNESQSIYYSKENQTIIRKSLYGKIN